ncbi:helix-turn-helix domain-containing protein [bacterium]|nr:helix-turn-helix domain-containing protein [bacterium]
MARKIGDRIKELRNKKELTQAELADKLGFTSQTVSNWESGIREPDIDSLTQLASLFNVSLDYLLLGKQETLLHSMRCPVCGGDRFVKPYNFNSLYKEGKVTCIKCGYTFSIRSDIKVQYFEKLKELKIVLNSILLAETELKQLENKKGDVSQFKKELKNLKKKQQLLRELGEENKIARSIDESIKELEMIIVGGKDESIIRNCDNLEIEIKRLKSQRDLIIHQLRDPFKKDVDIIKEASDKNLANLEKEIIRECLDNEMDNYPHPSLLNPSTYYQIIKLDDSFIESYDKLLSVLGTLRLKPIHLTDDAEKAEYILVESDERKHQIGDKAISTKEFENYWGITFHL